MNTAEEEELALVHSFNAAYDALNSNGSSSGSVISGRMGSSMASAEGTDISTIVNGGSMGGNISGIGAGIRQAVALQKSIVSTAMLLVERKSITRLSHFRYAYLNATSNAGNGGTNLQSKASISNGQTTQKYSHHVFAKPLALTKLALFLMDMHRYNKKWTGSKARPLILLAEKPQTQTYLIVGFDFAEEKGSLCKNQFKQKFKLVTDTMKGSFKYDSFESNVIEVKASDAQKFIEHLHYMMDSI
jgi:cell division control protein 45